MVPALLCVRYIFENYSNGIDDDVHGYDENGDSENDDIAALECDITEGEVYEAIRMLRQQDPIWSLENFSKILLHMLSPF